MTLPQYAATARGPRSPVTVPVGRWRPQDRLRWPGAAAALLLGLLLTAPLAAVPVPFLLDYPNHLARMQVLISGSAVPALHAMFRPAWAFIPNMAMDLVVPVLARVLPLTVAGKLFIALAMLLPPAGVVALHRSWFGTRTWWPWIAVVAAVNACLVLGFLNYLVGLGLALLGGAWHARAGAAGPDGDGAATAWRGDGAATAWRSDGAATAWRSDGAATAWRSAAGVAWGITCLLCHIFAFGILVLLMLSTEAGRIAREGPHRLLLRRAVPILATAAVPLLLYRAFGPARSYAGSGALALAGWQILHDGMFSQPYFRVRWVFAAATGESEAVGAVAAAVLLMPVAWAALRRRLRVAPEMVAAFTILALLYAVLPPVLVDNGMVYERLSVPLALIGIAGVRPLSGQRAGAALALAVVALVAGRSALNWRNARAQAGLLAAFEQTIAAIPAGAHVLAVRDGHNFWDVDPDESRARRILGSTVDYQHLPALVTLERDAFWPMIFATPGKQPVALRPDYAAAAQQEGLLPLTSQLGPTETMAPLPGPCPGGDPAVLPCQLYSWPRRYDFLLRLNAHDDPPAGAAHLRELERHGWTVLYRVLPAGTR